MHGIRDGVRVVARLFTKKSVVTEGSKAAPPHRRHSYSQHRHPPSTADSLSMLLRSFVAPHPLLRKGLSALTTSLDAVRYPQVVPVLRTGALRPQGVSVQTPGVGIAVRLSPPGRGPHVVKAVYTWVERRLTVAKRHLVQRIDSTRTESVVDAAIRAAQLELAQKKAALQKQRSRHGVG